MFSRLLQLKFREFRDTCLGAGICVQMSLELECNALTECIVWFTCVGYSGWKVQTKLA